MLSKNFYNRIKYQIDKKAITSVFYQFFIDRIKHPFTKFKKKELRDEHKVYLRNKKISADYFSINTYYWNLIINKNFKKLSYLEIGSWEGNSAMYILKNFKTTNVVCVDIWNKYNDKYENKNDQLQRFENFKYNLSEFRGRFSFFKDSSDEFFKNNHEKFDVIYVDGWHKAQQVYKDIINAWQVLRVDGIIICDDYFHGNLKNNSDKDLPADSINKFLLEREKKLEILCVNNSQIFFKKISD